MRRHKFSNARKESMQNGSVQEQMTTKNVAVVNFDGMNSYSLIFPTLKK